MNRVRWQDAHEDVQRIAKKDLPFALAKTLTETARGASGYVKMETRRKFKLRSGNFVPGGVRFKPANKRDFGNNMDADVHTAPIISDFMPDHETGEVRYPKRSAGRDRGKAIAIPGKNLPASKRLTAKGRTKRQYKPSVLLANYKGPRLQRVRRGRGKGQPFIIRGARSGVPMIVRRRGRGRYPLELLYIFSDRAKIPKTWGFEPAVRRYVAHAFLKKFHRNTMAIRGAY